MGEYRHHVVYPLLEDRLEGSDPDLGARGNSVPMSSELWTGLPAEIVERALLFLPAKAQSRLQLVCRTWRLLLTSRAFREESTSRVLADRHRLCLLWGYAMPMAIADHPRTVDLCFLPAKFSRLGEYYSPSFFGFYSSYFSWVSYAIQDGQLWLRLVNLEKKTCTELPPLLLQPLSAAQELRVESVGKVVQEPQSFFFHITVLLLIENLKVIVVARYSSRGGVWTTSRLDLATPPWFRFCHALLYQDSRVQVISARTDGNYYFWQLASFSIENTGAGDARCVGKGCLPLRSLPVRCLSSRETLVAHSGGIFCIRVNDDSSMRTTISIFSWTLPIKKDRKYGEYGGRYDSKMEPIAVLTLKHTEREVTVLRAELINNTILILMCGDSCPGLGSMDRYFIRVMGYDVQKESWLRLVF